MKGTSIWRGGIGESLVIRTDFSDDGAWRAIQQAIAAPQEEDFTANVRFVDDRACDGITVPELLDLVPAGFVDGMLFVVDGESLTHADQPVLVVNLCEAPGRPRGTSFRVIPSEMWCVENNLALANMDWSDFAGNLDSDGVFRGFE